MFISDLYKIVRSAPWATDNGDVGRDEGVEDTQDSVTGEIVADVGQYTGNKVEVNRATELIHHV